MNGESDWGRDIEQKRVIDKGHIISDLPEILLIDRKWLWRFVEYINSQYFDAVFSRFEISHWNKIRISIGSVVWISAFDFQQHKLE